MLALGLFPRAGLRERVGAPDRGAAALAAWRCPSAKALRDLRRRIGAAPLKALFEVLAGPAGRPSAPGVRFGRYRTVAFDGCTSVKVPDTGRNRAWLGKMNAALGVTGYPAVQLMTLVETGTRALIGAVFGPLAGEAGYARQLLHLLRPDMLVLADRGFDADRVPGRGRRDGRPVPGAAERGPPPAGHCTPGRRDVPVPDRRAAGADHPGAGHRHCADGTPGPAATGWPLPWPTTAATPLRNSSGSTTSDGNTRSPTWRCGTPSWQAGYCARATRPDCSRRSGRCWPSTRRCAAPWSPPSRQSPAPILTAPASPSRWKPPARP